MSTINFHDYQLEAVEHCLRLKCAMLLGSIGSGKTPIALELVQQLKNRLLIRRALIVAPPKVVTNVYRAEKEKWDNFKYLRMAILHGPRKEEFAHSKADVYVVSYNSLEWLFGLDTEPFDAIILDESHYIKSSKSKRFKVLEKNLGKIPYRIDMTGSPIGNKLVDLWSQYFLLDGGERLFRSEDTFLNYWFKPPYKGFTWKIKPGARKEITHRVADITYEIPATKVALPELKENIIPLTLPHNLREQYDLLEEESIIEFKNTEIAAFSIGVLLQKLRQFACGFMYGATKEDPTIHIHDIKIKALEQRLDEAGNRIMIVANFREEFAMLQRAFPGIRCINGATSDKETSAIIDQWNAKDLDLLAVHPKSAGIGLNLQSGGHRQIFLSPDWSLLDRNQTIGRLYRQGQESDTVIIDNFVMEGTIEETIMSAIQQKIDTVEGFINELRKYWGLN